MKKRGILLIFLAFISIVGFSQIKSNADLTIPAKYPVSVTQFNDSIYLKFGPSSNGFSDTLKLTAISPYGSNSSISWYSIEKNDETSQIDLTLVASSSDADSLSINTIFNQGFQVKISKNSQDTTITCWAYMDNLSLNDLNYKISCYDLSISGIEGGISFSYFNPEDINEVLLLKNGLNVNWIGAYVNDAGISLPLPEEHALLFEPAKAPYFSQPPIDYKTYLFRVSVSDSFGYFKNDSLIYQSIAVNAKFKVSKNYVEYSDDSLNFEAPTYLGFINKSINAEEYEWTFYNDSLLVNDGKPIVIKTSSFFEPLDSVLYNYPGKYDVKLIVKGRVFVENGEENTCIDSLYQRSYITIYNSFVGKLPNVITPNHDGVNDEFYFIDIDKWDYTIDPPSNMPTTSIKLFEIYIYNRYGLRVFHFKGSKWTKSDAWKGKYNGQTVGSGVYYYYIRTLGYDNRVFKKKGFFHVYSNK